MARRNLTEKPPGRGWKTQPDGVVFGVKNRLFAFTRLVSGDRFLRLFLNWSGSGIAKIVSHFQQCFSVDAKGIPGSFLLRLGKLLKSFEVVFGLAQHVHC